jgi:hypothetical protein
MAATNRFSVSPDNAYTMQYTPLPFEAISALGEKANKNFEEGKQVEANLGALGAAIKAAPMYQDDRLKFVNDYNTQLKTLVDEAKGDYGSKDFKAKANALTTQFRNDPKLQAFKGTLDAYEEYVKRKGKEGAERDLDYTYERDAAGNFIQKDVIKDGKYGSKFTKYEDWNETGKKVMGKIAEDSITKEMGLDLGNTRINNGETEVWSRKTGKFEGVTGTKLGNLSQRMVGEYANTDAGKHHLQSLLGQDIDYLQLNRLAQSGDEGALKTKAAIDKEFANHLYNSNANQVGTKQETTYADHFVTNRARVAANDAITESLNRTPLDVLNYAQNKPSDLNNAIPETWKTLFSFGKSGETILSDHTNAKNTYVGKNNQVYDITNIPLMGAGNNKGLTRRLSKTGMTIYKDGIPIDNAIKHEGINSELIKQKQFAANDYLRATGQLEDYKKKYPNPSDMATAALQDMAQGVKSGTYHNQAVPIFSEETNQALTKRLLPTFNDKGDITGSGLVGNMSVIDDLGNNIPYSEADKLTMLKGSKVTGGSFIGGDVIKVTNADGSVTNLKLNMPTLNAKNKGIVEFIQKTNKQVAEPLSVVEQQARTKNITRTYLDKIKNIQESNSDPRIKELRIEDANRILNTIGSLEKEGFVQAEKFNMSNGDTAYSFINYKIPGHPTQGLVIHSNGEISFANISSIGAEEFQSTYTTSIENASPKSEKMSTFTTVNQNP